MLLAGVAGRAPITSGIGFDRGPDSKLSEISTESPAAGTKLNFSGVRECFRLVSWPHMRNALWLPSDKSQSRRNTGIP